MGHGLSCVRSYPTYEERMKELAEEITEIERRAKHFDALIEALEFIESYLDEAGWQKDYTPRRRAHAAINAAKEEVRE